MLLPPGNAAVFTSPPSQQSSQPVGAPTLTPTPAQHAVEKPEAVVMVEPSHAPANYVAVTLQAAVTTSPATALLESPPAGNK